MGMRLLGKREVDLAKSKDKQMAIAEGLKLASRVDTLREISAEEEQSLEKYRVETLSNIADQIKAKHLELVPLEKEVKALEVRRISAIAPLKERESDLALAEAILEARNDAANRRENELYIRAENVVKQEEEARIKTERADVVHTTASTFMVEASTIRGDAERKNRLADDILLEAQTKSSAIIANADEINQALAKRVESVFEKEEANRKVSIELANEWIRLRDREATLERNLKRK